MAAIQSLLAALYIAIGVLPQVHALHTGQLQCHRHIFDGRVTACTYPCVIPSATTDQHVIFLHEPNWTPCMYGYCFDGHCNKEDNHHALKRKKRSLKSFFTGWYLGRRWGEARARRLNRFHKMFGWR